MLLTNQVTLIEAGHSLWDDQENDFHIRATKIDPIVTLYGVCHKHSKPLDAHGRCETCRLICKHPLKGNK